MDYRKQLEADAWMEMQRHVSNTREWRISIAIRHGAQPLIEFTNQAKNTIRFTNLYVTDDGHIQNCRVEWK
jgi:hypothetical protein